MNYRSVMIFTAPAVMLLFAAILSAEDYRITDRTTGKELYEDKCQICHGEKGGGDGLAAVSLSPRPANFTDPAFWKNDVNRKITEAVTKGKGAMPPVPLKPSRVDALIDYMTRAFKR